MPNPTTLPAAPVESAATAEFAHAKQSIEAREKAQVPQHASTLPVAKHHQGKAAMGGAHAGAGRMS